jgi:hypothetical protein
MPSTPQQATTQATPSPSPTPTLRPSSQGLATGPPSRTHRYNPPAGPCLQLTDLAAWPMTSEQAAQLIDDTLDLVHQV